MQVGISPHPGLHRAAPHRVGVVGSGSRSVRTSNRQVILKFQSYFKSAFLNFCFILTCFPLFKISFSNLSSDTPLFSINDCEKQVTLTGVQRQATPACPMSYLKEAGEGQRVVSPPKSSLSPAESCRDCHMQPRSISRERQLPLGTTSRAFRPSARARGMRTSLRIQPRPSPWAHGHTGKS